MASTFVYNRIREKLRADLPYDIIDFDTIDSAMQQREEPFLVLEELNSDETQTSMGDPLVICMRESGSILIHGFVPAPESSLRARQLSDEIREVLRHARISDIHIPEVAPADMEILNEGLWSSAGTFVRYNYDFHIDRRNPWP